MNYYIASLKHTSKFDEHICFWGPNHCGYTPVVGERIGEYTLEEAQKLNNGDSCVAVPVDSVKPLLSPEPYWRPGARFYDQRGPVVQNTRKQWLALIAASLEAGRHQKPKPEAFRGTRRATFTEVEAAA